VNEILTSAAELTALLPHYASTSKQDERAMYFRGLMAKAADSLIAIDILTKSTGPVWPLHCRWIIEAFGMASALNANENFLDEIKKNSANTYYLVAEVDDETRRRMLNDISPREIPNFEMLLRRFEESMGISETGTLYKIYRLLSEYAHFEFFRIIAYPALGVEAASELEKRKTLFLNVTVAAALSLPCFAHCPPSCGFDDDPSRRSPGFAAKLGKKYKLALATKFNVAPVFYSGSIA
jgi:hypothetical protein